MHATGRHGRAAPGKLEWTVRGLLVLVFLFTGVVKLVLPLAALTQQGQIPGPFLRFIGICEVLGALGLVLPDLLRVHEELTRLAAGGLVVIMSGAIGAMLAVGPVGPALLPLIVGVLAGYVAYAAGGRAAEAGVPAERRERVEPR